MYVFVYIYIYTYYYTGKTDVYRDHEMLQELPTWLSRKFHQWSVSDSEGLTEDSVRLGFPNLKM